MTSDSHITTDNYNKIFKLNNVIYCEDQLLVIAMAGVCAHFHKILDVLYTDEKPEQLRHDVHGIIVGKKYVYTLEPNEIYLIEYPKKTHLVTGSGESFARAAMLLGKSAVEAVNVAKKLDAATGGRIRSYTCE